MPKPPPEKLAAALRANLKRRKQASPAKPASKPAEAVGEPPEKPPKISGKT